MPWLLFPMKDVAGCDKPRRASQARITAGDVRMGKPNPSYVGLPRLGGEVDWVNWNILVTQEKKSTEIPRVVASEMGTAQTPLRRGVVGLHLRFARCSRRNLERTAKEGNSPVGETPSDWGVSWVRSDTCNPARIRGDHPPRLNRTGDR